MSDPLIRIEGIAKRYTGRDGADSTVFENIHFAVERELIRRLGPGFVMAGRRHSRIARARLRPKQSRPRVLDCLRFAPRNEGGEHGIQALSWPQS